MLDAALTLLLIGITAYTLGFVHGVNERPRNLTLHKRPRAARRHW